MRRHRAGRAGSVVLIALAALATAGGASAQEVPDTGERTGPEAEPPPLPSFPEPDEVPPPIMQAPPPPPAVPLPATATIVRQARVTAEGEGDDAVPPRRWVAPADPLAGLRLIHTPGQALDPAWVEAQFARHLGPDGAPVSTAVALVQLINRAFVTAGFVNSGLVVPPQPDLASGILDLRLIYGHLAAAEGVEAVTVEWGPEGPAGLSEGYVRSRFPSTRERPLSALDVERDFRLLAEDPAIRTVTASLRPGARPGEAGLHLIIHPEERYDLYLGAANDRSPSVGGERVYAGGYARSLVTAGDLLTAEGGLTEGVEDISVGYNLPVLTPRTTLSVRGSYNEAAVIDTPLIPLDIRAEDRSAQGGITHRFIEEPLSPGNEPGSWSPSRSLAGGLQLVWREQQSFLLGEPFSFAPGSVDGRAEYYALRAIGDYLTRNVDQVLAVSLTATMGLDGTRSDVPSIPNPDRNFVALLGQLNYARRLNARGLELRGRLTGQVANSVLYSGERISIGGESSVRGYRENLFLADNALIGSVELAHPINLAPRGASSGFEWGRFTASAFTDAAAFENVGAADPFEDWVASVGLSLAWTPSDAILARVAYGHALNDVPLGGGPMAERDLQDHGFHFRIVVHPLRLLR